MDKIRKGLSEMIGWCGEFADILLCIPLFPSFGVMICVLGSVCLVAESLRNHITWGTVCFFNNKTNFLDPGKKKNQLDFTITSWTLLEISAMCFVYGYSDFLVP